MAGYSPVIMGIDKKMRGIENALCDLYKEIIGTIGEGECANDDEAKVLRRMQNACVNMLKNAFRH